MEKKKQRPDVRWYYIIVRNPGTLNEQFIGLSDEKEQKKFIPAFETKEQAKACFALMPKDILNGKYDIHAVLEDDILSIAGENDHRIYLLDGKGAVLSRLN